MKGAILYFSATGNTEFIANCYKDEFIKKDIPCDMFEISKNKNFEDKYDFYVIGAPIHAELYPYFFMDYILNNLKEGHHRKCLMFSTEASAWGSGPYYLGKKLEDKGFNPVVLDCYFMPNNYYLVMGKNEDFESKEKHMDTAKEKASKAVELFLKGESYKASSSKRLWWGKPVSKLFLSYSKKWAQKNLSVDKNKCIKCGKCVIDCPVHNISLNKDNIEFSNKCVSCQRCLHSCPKNAFLYKGKSFEAYRLK